MIKQSKTGATATALIVPELHAALDLCPRDRLTFIAQADGRPLGAETLGGEFRDWLRKAGLPDRLALHGLRKRAMERLAEARATEREIMAVSGHKTSAEVDRYCREAEKTRLLNPVWGRSSICSGRRNIRELFFVN